MVTLDSNEARMQWRDMLDNARGRETIITRYKQPVAVLIDYDTWLAVREHIDAYQKERIREEINEWRRNPTTARPWSEIQAEMIAEGLLDEAPPT